MRDHDPIAITEFNGLWKRGDIESCPLDHFSDCNNVQYVQSGFKTRDGISLFTVGDVEGLTLFDIRRIYMFVHHGVESLLALDNSGNIYHTKSPTPFTPILTIDGMTDFAFVQIAGRAYISPHDGVTGLNGEFVYVYLGDGTPARKAAGAGPTLAPVAAISATAGNVEEGYHVFAVAYETDTGFITELGPGVALNVNVADKKVDLSAIPVSSDPFVVARHVVATKAINPLLFTGDLNGYQFFFVPGGRIADNTSTTLAVNFYDAELLSDASHLEDLYSEIPAGVSLTTFHNRLVVAGLYGAPSDIVADDKYSLNSTALLSEVGEPEAIDQVDGLIVVPLDSEPLTAAQEYRDLLYLFKRVRTYSAADNGGQPSTWAIVTIDQGIGASVHGVGTVLDSGGVNVEYLTIIDFSGIMLFDGSYRRPELSYKIKDYWFDLDRSEFKNFQIMNDSLGQILYISLNSDTMIIGDYTNGMAPDTIKWGLWTFHQTITTISLIDTNHLILGSKAIDVV